jgi:hypothetical protein
VQAISRHFATMPVNEVQAIEDFVDAMKHVNTDTGTHGKKEPLHQSFSTKKTCVTKFSSPVDDDSES